MQADDEMGSTSSVTGTHSSSMSASAKEFIPQQEPPAKVAKTGASDDEEFARAIKHIDSSVDNL